MGHGLSCTVHVLIKQKFCTQSSHTSTVCAFRRALTQACTFVHVQYMTVYKVVTLAAVHVYTCTLTCTLYRLTTCIYTAIHVHVQV